MRSAVTLKIVYPYLAQASINACFNQGNVRKGLKSEVRAWKEGLTLMVRNQVQHCEKLTPPFQLCLRLFAPRTVRIVDSGNFAKLIEDAVFDALPFDDNDTHLVRGPYSGIKTRQTAGFFVILIKEIGSLDSCYEQDVLDVFDELYQERLSGNT